jgi:alpha-glucoside transport system permease protein
LEQVRGRPPVPPARDDLLGVWVVYPAIYTIFRSFFGQSGFDNFVGIDNYKTLFTSDLLLTAIKNNAIWVAVVPAFVTAVGLIFAVLTERVSWSVAFKTAVFMPMAISAFAAGVIWRIMDQQEPESRRGQCVDRGREERHQPARRPLRCEAVEREPARNAERGPHTAKPGAAG